MFNYFAVLTAAIASIALGALWYSPILFGPQWAKLTNTPEADLPTSKKPGIWKSYVVVLISTLVGTGVFATLFYSLYGHGVSGAVELAFLVWLGFVAPVLLGSALWEKRPIELYVINVSYYLVSLLLTGVLIGAW